MAIAQRTAEAAKEGGFLGIGGTRVSENETVAIPTWPARSASRRPHSLAARVEAGRGPASAQSLARRSLSALAITDTELKVIAALAIIGLKSSPRTGYRTPAAIGTPSTL